jgi:transposase
MDRTDLQPLSKDQLIELVLRLQRPDKNSRTSSKPPSTDKKEKRENSRPGGAVGWRTIPMSFVTTCRALASSATDLFSSDADRELVGEYDEIEKA